MKTTRGWRIFLGIILRRFSIHQSTSRRAFSSGVASDSLASATADDLTRRCPSAIRGRGDPFLTSLSLGLSAVNGASTRLEVFFR